MQWHDEKTVAKKVTVAIPHVAQYECPQLSLTIITSDLETNKIEPRSYLNIPC